MIPNKIVQAIKEAKTIAILPHVNADGDALGSCLALSIALGKMQKTVEIFIQEEVPLIYSFLPGAKGMTVYKGGLKDWDLAIALDSGDFNRLGSRQEIFEKAKVTANIDHHQTNTEFAFHNYVDTNASATGEIIFELAKSLDCGMDKDMATCLYVAIATDTGGFRFSNTTAATHRLTSQLLEQGIGVAEISQKIFEAVSLGKVKLMGAAIGSLELYENNKAVFMTLSDEAMKSAGAKEEDCDGIVNIARNIHSVEVAVLLRVRENGEIKVNLRSKNYVDVAAIANLYKGGGHKRAAGCTTQGSLEDVKKKLLNDIKEVI